METIQTNKIKDIDEFTKLFKINIPVQEEFDYYIETLKKSNEYSKLDSQVKDFIELEQWVIDNGYESIRHYKMKTLDLLKEYIEKTSAYSLLQNKELSSIKAEKKDALNQIKENQLLLSLDFRSANYSVLKTFDNPQQDELKEGWEALCSFLGVHKTLANSKSFRQLVFGNTNPKRLQTFQHANITKVLSYFKSLGYTDNNFVFISHDEIVLQVLTVSEINEITNSLEQLSVVASGMKLRATLYSLSKIRKNVFIKSVYIKKEASLSANFEIEMLYKTLHGVPGNKFYMLFKEHILNEPIEDRDLLYYSDDELCKWVVENKSKKEKLPHYEKPTLVISLEDAAKDYSYVWNEMSNRLPNLSAEEKRRVIEIFANTCKSCFEFPIGCRCWDDD